MKTKDNPVRADHARHLAKAKQSLRSRPGYLLRRCLQNTSSLFEDACADTGITLRQYDVLFVLGQVGEMTQGELSQLLDIDRSTNALVIGILEEKGLIARWGHPRDTRKKCVGLTPEGQTTLNTIKPRAQIAANALLEGLDSAEQQALLATLNKIIDGVG
ncbi:MarR family winged helix-turn-helix transcriptional regulator [Falsiphaeobacter marinintestinus]|uniref:MarR family winged helix-turn-helix transcriptional regulator n=1 Tax=Falsiphaeobacter marinintestinus TaxID=1492905 RepID=UPI0016452978|nr:MarR family winged helix-turn-helix transcriptional regulator [Phaeobacter marinintestinus]